MSWLTDLINAPKRAPIVCKDGLTMSIQASSMHHCTPENDDGPYTEVEIGKLSAPVSELDDYGEWSEDSDYRVYNFVPLALVVAIIAEHGGIVSGELPPRAPHEQYDAEYGA
jgi:hypothetical protein